VVSLGQRSARSELITQNSELRYTETSSIPGFRRLRRLEGRRSCGEGSRRLEQRHSDLVTGLLVYDLPINVTSVSKSRPRRRASLTILAGVQRARRSLVDRVNLALTGHLPRTTLAYGYS
jgi:hypothetical protein